jgi:hypothetical protein
MKRSAVDVGKGNTHPEKVAASVFDAADWIRSNCAGAHELRPETLKVVSSFTLTWNFFENIVCDRRANTDKFDPIAAALPERNEALACVAEGSPILGR